MPKKGYLTFLRATDNSDATGKDVFRVVLRLPIILFSKEKSQHTSESQLL